MRGALWPLVPLLLMLAAGAARAEGFRVATWDIGLSGKGPGLALADLRKGGAQGAAALEVLLAADADVVLLTDIDWDGQGLLLEALAARLAARGLDYPHRLALPTNAGLPSGVDLDGDGTAWGARDAQGYGRFTGDGGMALLSRRPLRLVADLSAQLWAGLPGNLLEGAGLSAQAQAVQRLSSSGHWDVEVAAPGGPLRLLAFAATPPVFDGPEDRNGRRNHDETALWSRYLDGALGGSPPADRFVLLGRVNVDPAAGTGRRGALAALLADPRLHDPRPAAGDAPPAPPAPPAPSPGRGPGMSRSPGQALGPDLPGPGDPGQATAEFGGQTGSLRTEYVLPSRDLRVRGAAVLWPAAGALAEAVRAAGRHRLVLVDLDLP